MSLCWFVKKNMSYDRKGWYNTDKIAEDAMNHLNIDKTFLDWSNDHIKETLSQGDFDVNYFNNVLCFEIADKYGSVLRNDPYGLCLILSDLSCEESQFKKYDEPLEVSQEVELEKVLEHYGYTLVCESPLELEDETTGAFVTCQFASSLAYTLKKKYNEDVLLGMPGISTDFNQDKVDEWLDYIEKKSDWNVIRGDGALFEVSTDEGSYFKNDILALQCAVEDLRDELEDYLTAEELSANEKLNKLEVEEIAEHFSYDLLCQSPFEMTLKCQSKSLASGEFGLMMFNEMKKQLRDTFVADREKKPKFR